MFSVPFSALRDDGARQMLQDLNFLPKTQSKKSKRFASAPKLHGNQENAKRLVAHKQEKKSLNLPVLHTFEPLRLLHRVHLLLISPSLPYLDHFTELPASNFINSYKLPLKPPRLFVRRRAGEPAYGITPTWLSPFTRTSISPVGNWRPLRPRTRRYEGSQRSVRRTRV